MSDMSYSVNDIFKETKYVIPNRIKTIKTNTRKLARRIAVDLGRDLLDAECFTMTDYYYLKAMTSVKDLTLDELEEHIDSMFERVQDAFINVGIENGQIYKKTSSWSVLYYLWLVLDKHKLYLVRDIVSLLPEYLVTSPQSFTNRLRFLNTHNALVRVNINKRLVYWGLPTVVDELEDKYEKVEGQLIYICR